MTNTRVERENATEEVVDWRLAQLLRAGYRHEEAALIAVQLEIDLHRAVSLVQSGCPPETALAILA